MNNARRRGRNARIRRHRRPKRLMWRNVMLLFAIVLLIGTIIVLADGDSYDDYDIGAAPRMFDHCCYHVYDYPGYGYLSEAPGAGYIGDYCDLYGGCCPKIPVFVEEYGYLGEAPVIQARAKDGYIQIYVASLYRLLGDHYRTVYVYANNDPYFAGHHVTVPRRHGYVLGGWNAFYLDNYGNMYTLAYSRDITGYYDSYYSAVVVPTRPGGIRIFAVFQEDTGGSMGIAPFSAFPTTTTTVTNEPGLRNAVTGLPINGQLLIWIQGNIPLNGANAALARIDISGGRTIAIVSAGTNLTNHTGANRFTITAQGTALGTGETTGAGRHFNVSGNSTLLLSNIILDGGRGALTQNQARGGIQLTGSRLYMHPNTIIRNNRSPDVGQQGGGGVLAQSGSTFTMHGGHIYNNRTINAHGGGVSVNLSTFIMHGGTISHNRTYGIGVGPGAGSGSGGGVNLSSNINNPNGSVFTMHGGTISHNHSGGWSGGGGVFFGPHTTGTIHNGNILHNTSAHGGGIWVMGGNAPTNPVVINNATIGHNRSGVGPGSHFNSLTQYPASALTGVPLNRQGGGGGIYICCGARVTMNGGIIEHNIARVGGGIFISHSAGGNRNNPRAYFRMRSGIVRYNRATVTHLDPVELLNPNFPNIGIDFDRDGGGLFITEAGNFVMENHDNGAPGNIYFYGNIADNSGGGIYWGEGRWYTHNFTGTITIRDNQAHGQIYRQWARRYNGGTGNPATSGSPLETVHNRRYIRRGATGFPHGVPGQYVYRYTTSGGGGLFLAYGVLNMHGTWIIENNTAHRGGGVFLTGDATPYSNTGLPHPDMGHGHLIMHYGHIYNNHSHTSGGGVYIYRDGLFTMHNGSIEYNSSALYGGGVYVFNPGIHFDSEFRVYGGLITRNTALYGGGVYLMYRGRLHAANVHFTNNTAQRMGGAIFTQLVDYGYLLSGLPVPHTILFPTPPDPGEIFHAFTNLTLTNTVRFSGNSVNTAAFHSPYNALTLTNIQWYQWNVPGQEHVHLSIHIHPFNNYDINYVRPVYFYKTDMAIYSVARAINNRAGAVFTLDRWAYCSSDGIYAWRQYTTAAGAPVTATSEANGRVALFAFTPGNFRMREITPPTGLYTLPPGHWYLQMELVPVTGSAGVPEPMLFIVVPPTGPPIQACPLNADFHFILLDRQTHGTVGDPGVQPARMRWHVGNSPPRAAVRLHKTGDGIIGMTPPPTQLSQIDSILLQGAQFVLYRYTGTGTPANTLVPAPGWVLTPGIHTSTGNAANPINLALTVRAPLLTGYYQLVEIFAPPGFMTPLGQWRIRTELLDAATNAFNITVLQSQGDTPPTLLRLTGETGFVFAVGNRRLPTLPMTGGLGRNVTIASGVIVVMVALVIYAMAVPKRKTRYRYRI